MRKSNFFLVNEWIQIQPKSVHHQPASKTPFKWGFTGMLMMAQHWMLARPVLLKKKKKKTLNASLVALWFLRESGLRLLRNPIFYRYFRGFQTPVPPLDPHVPSHGDGPECPQCMFLLKSKRHNTKMLPLIYSPGLFTVCSSRADASLQRCDSSIGWYSDSKPVWNRVSVVCLSVSVCWCQCTEMW